MLLKAEKILSEDQRERYCSEEDFYKFINHELVEKLLQLALEKNLIKTVTTVDWDDQKGEIIKIHATLRAYNPDD